MVTVPETVILWKTSVCDAVTQFNHGEKGRKRLYKTLNLNVGINAIKGLQREEKNRLRKASAKVSEKYRKRRQALRSIRKNKNKNKNKHKSYMNIVMITLINK